MSLLAHHALLMPGFPDTEAVFDLNEVSVSFTSILSIRRLTGSAPYAIRVKRSSDSSEQDIGFNSAALDVDALLAFAGGSSASVVTIYDQSGNGCNAVAASEPRIVNAGAFDGAVIFDGSANYMTISGMSFGTPYLGLYERLYQPSVSASRVIAEATTNFNTASQAFFHFAGVVSSNSGWSLNASNSAGNQRANQYAFTQSGQETLSCLWDRTLTGTNEIAFYRDGSIITPPTGTPGTTEQTGNFSAYTVYVGSRGGSTLFNNMQLEAMVFTNQRSSNARPAIENGINQKPELWRSRLNTPTSIFKIGSYYFLVDCWHHRVLFSDDPARQIWAWDTLDESNLLGPHSIASDGTIYVVDNTDQNRIEYYGGTAPALTRLGSVSLSSGRPHRIVYDSTTSAFYAIRSQTKQIVKLTRSGMTLSVAHTTTLSFLTSYARSFRIIGGKMIFVNQDGTVNEVSFDGTSSGYVLDATYDLPAHMTDCNDVFLASSGKWYATSWDPALIEFDSLAGMHAGTYTDVYSEWGLQGLPYWFEEFDSALWLGSIVAHNGIVKRASGVTTVVHNYGNENASSFLRHNNFTPA